MILKSVFHPIPHPSILRSQLVSSCQDPAPQAACPSTYGVRISNVKSDFSNSSMLSDCTVEGIKGLAFPSRPLLQI